MDKEVLEHQYSPSRWSKRFLNADAVIQNHITVTTQVSLTTRENVPYSENVRYGAGKKQLVDIFGTDLPKDAPLLIYIHGGYWQDLNKDMSSYPVRPFYDKKIRVVIVGYDLAPQATMAEIIGEMSDLWSFVTNLGLEYKTKGVWFVGHSAGAHLASILLSRWTDEPDFGKKSLLKGVIFLSGVFDLLPLIDTYVNDALKMSRDEAIKYSTMSKVGLKYDLKLLVVVGEHESDEFLRQSQKFHQILTTYNSAEYFIVRGRDHFDIVENLSCSCDILTTKILNLITQ